MSGAAMSWAADRNRSGDMGTSERLVLIAMAEPADVDGRRSFLAVSTIADRIGLSVRQVRRCIGQLEQLGLITRATDQGPAAYLRPDKRPVVWDLQLQRGVARGMSSVSPRGERGDIQGLSGVSPVSPEPKTKPLPETPSVVEVTTTRTRAISAADDVDDLGRVHCVQCDVWAYPGLHSCSAVPRPSNFAEMVEQARLEAEASA